MPQMEKVTSMILYRGTDNAARANRDHERKGEEKREAKTESISLAKTESGPEPLKEGLSRT